MTIPQPIPPNYLTDFSPFFLLGSIVLFYALHVFYRATAKSVENFFFGSKRDAILTILGYTYALSFFFNSFILSLLTAADWVSVGSTLVSTLGAGCTMLVMYALESEEPLVRIVREDTASA